MQGTMISSNHTESDTAPLLSETWEGYGTETPLCKEECLKLTSEGQSLKFSTRNFPLRSAFEDKDINAADSTERISALYTAIGKTLSSPMVLAGVMNLATLFTNKASQLPHFYKRKMQQWAFIIPGAMFIVFLALLIIDTAHDSDTTTTGFLIIATVLPLILYAFGATFCMLLPACTCTLQLRSKLESLEPYLNLCELSNEDLNQIFYEEDHGICDYKVVGSAGDGFGFFASQGSNKQPLQEKAILTQDIDLNIFINTLSIKDEHLKRVPGAPGFTWIMLDEQEVLNIHDPVIKNSLYNIPGSKQYFLSAACISQEASRYFKVSESDNAQIIEHYPALTLRTAAAGPNGNQEYEVDYAFALRCPHWPAEASEWVTRTRAGIDEKTITDIASRGCYLVHKPCGKEEIQHYHEFDWRFTFASAEADLFHYHSDKRALKLAFVILKLLIKISTKSRGVLESILFSGICGSQSLVSGSPEIPVLRTYHLKTIFLWMAEQETNLDMYRIQGNKDLGKVFMTLLNRYFDCVKERNLPNYFMRDRNMLAGARYEERDFTNALMTLKRIRMQPTYIIAVNFERQFINKKTMIGLTALAAGLYFLVLVAKYSNEIVTNTSNDAAFTTTKMNDDAHWFTNRYLTYLESLYST